MKTFGITHIGLVREINEDNYFMSKDPIGILPNLFIIADGMGGHNAGEVASKLAVEEFVGYVKKCSSAETTEEIFIKATQYANNVIYEKSIHTSEMNGMGTTMVACSIIDDVLYVANIGDSRLYVTDNSLKQITIDHSYVEELIRVGEITRDESIHHPAKNKITRALGIAHRADPDIFKLSTKELSKIFLCSDGLTTMVRDERIFEILSSSMEIKEQGNVLVKEAIKNGGTDNITLLIIEIKN
ncbi:MAG: serine/threonine-protein phosphatase [Firmicutes bacterium HGW-Firmicutes-1]|jgi:protein phosphatase|nr:MAG: serine/threonine-protein phosphatase [Firmicutes bacterium HGW-Firmicutes-1]